MRIRKLSSKILSVVFVGTILILSALSFLTFSFTKSILEQSTMENQLEIARQTMNQIDRMLNERILNIQTIAGAPPIQNALIPEVPDKDPSKKIVLKRINEFTTLTGPWDVLMVANTEGEIVAASDESLMGRKISEHPENNQAYKESLREDFYCSDFVVSKSTGGLSILFSAPVRNSIAPGQPVIGVVIGHFSHLAVLQILEDVPMTAKLLNRDGVVLLQNGGRDEDLIAQRAAPAVRDKIKQSDSKSFLLHKRESLIGVESLASVAAQSGYLLYPGSGWGLVLEQPAADALATSGWTSMKLVGLLIPIILAGVFFLMVIITQWIIKPIGLLTRATHEITAGNLKRQAPILSDDEIGQLAASFNTMTERLKGSYEGLEGQVVKRTEELSKTVEDLKSEMKKRKELENVILQSEKMAAIGQLAGGVAHEINNPLGVILGFSQSLVRRIQPGDPLEMPLRSIEREAVRCRDLVQDLLTFSRTEKTEEESVDLKEALEGALSLVLAQSKVKNVELIKEILDAPKIVGSKNQIQQIIINLSNNAIDAMPQGGQLIIRVQKVTVEGRDWVELQVKDTGQGIPPAVKAKIFDPFFTTKEVGKGTGLGLSLVYEIVQKHRGQILVDSQVGKGTVFQIFFPLFS